MIKFILKSTLLTTLLISSSVSAVASELAFQVAIVKDATGSKDIMKGNVEAGIKELTERFTSAHSYANKMSLCVAYLKSSRAEESESACTDAITSIDSLALTSKKALYLKSLNYSNRGVSRYKNGDFDAALADFEVAISIDNNLTTKNNLLFIQQILSDMKIEPSIVVSD